jgi:hypothetical protein
MMTEFLLLPAAGPFLMLSRGARDDCDTFG